jgi:hypothetical protein
MLTTSDLSSALPLWGWLTKLGIGALVSPCISVSGVSRELGAGPVLAGALLMLEGPMPVKVLAEPKDAIAGLDFCWWALCAESSSFWTARAFATATSFRFHDSSTLAAAAQAMDTSRLALALVASLRRASFSWAQTAALGRSLASGLLSEWDDQLLAIFHSALLGGGLDDFDV